MTNKEYVIATNLAKIRIAINTIRDLVPGQGFGVPQKERNEAVEILYRWQDSLEKSVDTAVKG